MVSFWPNRLIILQASNQCHIMCMRCCQCPIRRGTMLIATGMKRSMWALIQWKSHQIAVIDKIYIDCKTVHATLVHDRGIPSANTLVISQFALNWSSETRTNCTDKQNRDNTHISNLNCCIYCNSSGDTMSHTKPLMCDISFPSAIKSQSNAIIQTTILAVSRLHEILR